MEDTVTYEPQVDEQQDPIPKPKLKVKDFAAKIKAKYPAYKDMDDKELTDKIIAKYPVYKDQVDFSEKKKGSVDLEGSSLEAGNSLSYGVDGGEKPTIEMYNLPNGEMVEADPISLSKKYNELKDRKKEISTGTGSSFTVGTGSTLVDDEEAQKSAKKLAEDFKDVDLGGIHEDFKDLNDEDYSLIPKQKLLSDRETNPNLFQREVSHLKWQKDFRKELFNSNISDDEYKRINHLMDELPIATGQGDYTNQRTAVQSLANDIKNYGGENKDKLLKDFAVEVSKVYGNPDNKAAETFKDTPESKYLTPEAQLGYQYLQDVSPDKAEQYKRLFIDAKSLKDKPDELKGYNHLMQTLEETGIGLKQNAVTEELNSLNNQAKQNGGLSPEQIERATKLEKVNEELSAKRNEMDSKYPDRIDDKVDDAVQEIMGQRLGGRGNLLDRGIGYSQYLGGKAWQGIRNTAQGVWEAASSPFMSDASNSLRELGIMGETLEENKIYHKTDKNKNVQYDAMVIQPEFQKQIDEIKNNGALSNDAKEQKLYTLLRENTDKFGRVPIKGGKFNINPSSIMYGLTDLGTQLLPFVGLEAVTGGGATAGLARKFVSTFTAAAATTFHDEYASALLEGKPQSEAYKSAMASTAINSLAMAGAGTPTEIRAMASGKTSASKIIAQMSDAEIEKVLAKGTPKGLKAFGQSLKDRLKATPQMALEGLKTGAKFEGFIGAANAIQGKEVNFKQSLLGIANFGIMGAGLGHIGYKSPTELQKSAGIEFANKPDEYIAVAKQMVKDGQLTTAEFIHRTDLIESYAEANKSLPKANAKGEPLSEKEKAEYLYNSVIKNEGNKSKSNLPPKQAEKAEMTALVADHKNDLILDPKTDKQLETTKSKLEAQLEKKDENGKSELNDKERLNVQAELEAVNDAIKNKKDTAEELPNLSVPIEGTDKKGVPIGEDVPPETKPTDVVVDEGVVDNAEKQKEIDRVNRTFFGTREGGIINTKEDFLRDYETSPSKERYDEAIKAEKTLDKIERMVRGGWSIDGMAKEVMGQVNLLNRLVEDNGEGLFHSGNIKKLQTAIKDEIYNSSKESTIDAYEKRITEIEEKYKPKEQSLSTKPKPDVVGSEVDNKNIEWVDEHPNIAMNMEFLGKVNGEKIGTALIKKEDGYYYHVGGKEVKIPNQARAEKAFNEFKESEKERFLSENKPIVNEQPQESEVVNPKEETGNPVTEPNKIEPAAEEGTGEVKGITQAANEVRRVDRGLPEYERSPESFEQWNNEAERLVKNGYDVEGLMDKIEKGHDPTPVENAIRKIYYATVDAEVAKNPTDKLLAIQKRLATVGDLANSRAGRNLVSLKGEGSPLSSISDFYVAKMDALGMDKLTEEQKAEVKKQYDHVQQTNADAAAKIKLLEEENARLKAEAAVKSTRSTTKKEKKDYTKEREDLKQSIKDKWKNAGKDILSSDIPYRAQLFAIAPDVAKLMKSYIEEGVTEFGEIVKKLHETIKDIEPRVTEKDIADILSGQYDVKKETKGDLLAKLKQIKNKKSEEAIKILARIKSEDFSKPEKNVSWVDNPELKKKFPKEYNAALDAIKAKEDARHEFDIALLRDQMARRTKGEIASDWLTKGAGTVKAITTGIDDSAVAIQTYVSMLVRPRTGVKAFYQHIRQGFSQKKFDRWLSALHSSPDFKEMREMGLDVTEPTSLKEREKEEIFNNRFNGTIKIKGKEYKLLDAPLKPFERAFTTLGNVTRVVGYRTISDKYKREGYTPEKNPELFQSLAKRLNTETGRGSVNEYVDMANKVVTMGIWSPKLMAQKFNILGISDLASTVLSKAGTKGYYRQLHPKERIAAIKDVAQFATTVMALSYGFALANGGEVDDDPLSSTFMDVKLPNGKSYNFTGGFSGYIRAISQFVAGKKHTGSESKKVGRLETAGRFFRGKTPPVTSAALNLASGKDFMGQPTSVTGEATHLLPISLQGIAQQIERDGATSFFTQGIPTFFGFNVKNEKDYKKPETQNHPKKKKQEKTKKQPKK